MGTHHLIAKELEEAIYSARPMLDAVLEADSLEARAPGKWSRKQILGHLLDSAFNNHQRFVRAQGAERLVWPGYAQEDWVRIQKYQDRPWAELVDLWTAVNRHLVHVIWSASDASLETPCLIGTDAPVTLAWLMADYVRHLRHHLEQIRLPV